MKCPYCAETIQDEAQKCRYCGELLTKADKMGFPRFYENVSEWGGLTFEALYMDYGEHLFPGEGFKDLVSRGVIGGLIYHGPEEDADRQLRSFISGVARRIGELDQQSQEALVLKIILEYLKLATSFSKTYEGKALQNDNKTLAYTVAGLRRLLAECAQLEQHSRVDFETLLQAELDMFAAREQLPQSVDLPTAIRDTNRDTGQSSATGLVGLFKRLFG